MGIGKKIGIGFGIVVVAFLVFAIVVILLSVEPPHFWDDWTCSEIVEFVQTTEVREIRYNVTNFEDQSVFKTTEEFYQFENQYLQCIPHGGPIVLTP